MRQFIGSIAQVPLPDLFAGKPHVHVINWRRNYMHLWFPGRTGFSFTNPIPKDRSNYCLTIALGYPATPLPDYRAYVVSLIFGHANAIIFQTNAADGHLQGENVRPEKATHPRTSDRYVESTNAAMSEVR